MKILAFILALSLLVTLSNAALTTRAAAGKEMWFDFGYVILIQNLYTNFSDRQGSSTYPPQVSGSSMSPGGVCVGMCYDQAYCDNLGSNYQCQKWPGMAHGCCKYLGSSSFSSLAPGK